MVVGWEYVLICAKVLLNVTFRCVLLLPLLPNTPFLDHLNFLHMTLLTLLHLDREHADLLLSFSK